MRSKIVTKNEDSGKRLDTFLTENKIATTRSQIKKMITQGMVAVDGKPAKVHQFLRPGQNITITPLQATPATKIKTAQTEKLPEPTIIFETKDYIILSKPTGMLVHPTTKLETNTLADWLLKKYPKIKNVGQVGPNDHRAGIVHRLDKDVSGIMIAVKNNKIFEHLKAQFKNREIYKEYIALVYGRIEQPAGEIDLPIGRNKEGLFVAHPLNKNEKLIEGDKLAKTRYTVIEYVKDYTLLKVNILTGRTHQIRVHLTAIGHPIIGDHIYRPRKDVFTLLRKRIKIADPGRIFLHSIKIGFKDLNNEWKEFESPLPQTLTKFIDEKRK